MSLLGFAPWAVLIAVGAASVIVLVVGLRGATRARGAEADGAPHWRRSAYAGGLGLVLVGVCSAALRVRQDVDGVAVSRWDYAMARYRSADPAARADGVWRLAEHGPEAVPHLRAALDDASAVVRQAAVTALQQVDPNAAPVAAQLGYLLVADPEAAEPAAAMLARAGPSTLPNLTAQLHSGDRCRAAGAVAALLYLGPRARPALESALADGTGDAGGVVFLVLSSVRPAPASPAALPLVLDSPHDAIAAAALWMVALRRDHVPLTDTGHLEVLHRLTGFLSAAARHRLPAVRRRATELLARCGVWSPAYAAVWVAALRDPERRDLTAEVDWRALGPGVTAGLAELLTDPDVGPDASCALIQIGWPAMRTLRAVADDAHVSRKRRKVVRRVMGLIADDRARALRGD